MTVSDAYLLGIFDGEGCITTSRRRPHDFYVHVQINMASEEIVRRFQSRFGGAVTSRSRLTAGGLTLWIWRVTGHGANDILRLAAGHSVTKRRQAQLALQILSLTMVGPRGSRSLPPADRALRETLSDEIRALNGARSRFTGGGPA